MDTVLKTGTLEHPKHKKAHFLPITATNKKTTYTEYSTNNYS
jgi:hypothetical protein